LTLLSLESCEHTQHNRLEIFINEIKTINKLINHMNNPDIHAQSFSSSKHDNS